MQKVVSTKKTRQQPFERIVRNSQILGGEPVVAGTRVPVRAIVLAHRFNPDFADIRQGYPMLTDEDIAAALAFYQRHRQEIDHFIRENE